jgi:hypothetical protein
MIPHRAPASSSGVFLRNIGFNFIHVFGFSPAGLSHKVLSAALVIELISFHQNLLVSHSLSELYEPWHCMALAFFLFIFVFRASCVEISLKLAKAPLACPARLLLLFPRPRPCLWLPSGQLHWILCLLL